MPSETSCYIVSSERIGLLFPMLFVWFLAVDLTLAEDALSPLERGQVEVDWEGEPGLPLLRGYKYRLVQVFSNLLLNACLPPSLTYPPSSTPVTYST